MLNTPGDAAAHLPRSRGRRRARLFAQAEDEEARVTAQVGLTWAMGATGKFIWPIPDKGLKKRIHRVKAPTLLIWGAEDRIVPPIYAEEFLRHIAGAQIETVEKAGHAPHLEQPAAVAGLVREFLRPHGRIALRASPPRRMNHGAGRVAGRG